MMGGVGSRFASDRPKQYIEFDGRPVFIYILNKLCKLDCIEKIIVVSNEYWIDFVNETIEKFITDGNERIVVAKGGNTRSESVKNGLAVLEKFAGDDDVVLIHDATHPYVDEKGTRAVIEAVKKYGGATLGACQFDTCYRMNEKNEIEEVIPRQFLVSGASPEAFTFRKIYEIYVNSSKEELEHMTSAGAIALAHHIKMVVIPAEVMNLKITYQNDMELFKLLAHDYFFTEN
jgi:2-C-methyl-D-erythritol 4-phosphate cytidylyltransferase